MAQRFEDFIGHEMSVVDAAAKILADTQTAFENDEITEDEFRELSNDILELHAAYELTNDIDDKAKFKAVFDTLRTIITTIAPLA